MNYPIKSPSKFINYRNRGLSLEKDLNQSNDYYRLIDKAIIYKKPTPIQVTKVDYRKKSGTIIKEAFFKVPSTTDYNGLYRGKYIDFEAKETKNKLSFPLASLHLHQQKHLQHIIAHGGIAFIIVRFTTHHKTFLVKGEDLITALADNLKSLPFSFFLNYAYEIKENYNPRLQYLDLIDQIYFGSDAHEKTKKKIS